MAYSKEIRDYAKELYLTPTENKEKKFTYKEIVKEVHKKFPEAKKTFTTETVGYWVKKYKWAEIWHSAVIEGIVLNNVPKEDLDDSKKIKDSILAFAQLTDSLSQSLILKGFAFFNEEWKPKTMEEAESVVRLGVYLRTGMYKELGSLSNNTINLNFNQTVNNESTVNSITNHFDESLMRRVIENEHRRQSRDRDNE